MRSTIIFAFVVLLAQGCTVIKAREPLYDRTKESTFNGGFAGVWANEEFRWTVVAGDPYGAVITIEMVKPAEESEPETFPADLVRIGSWRYMFPVDPTTSPEAAALQSAHDLPWCRLKREWDILRVSLVNPVALSQQLESGIAPFPFETEPRGARILEDGTQVLTPETVTINASARDIRRFLERNENDRPLFSPAISLKRER